MIQPHAHVLRVPAVIERGTERTAQGRRTFPRLGRLERRRTIDAERQPAVDRLLNELQAVEDQPNAHVLAGSAVVNLVLRDRESRRAQDRKSTRLNSSHRTISYAVFCLKKTN